MCTISNASLDLSGMSIYAYRSANETASDPDIFNYDDYKSYEDSPRTLTEEPLFIMDHLFHTVLGGYEDIAYLELGTHTVHVFLMGREAAYDIGGCTCTDRKP